MEMFFFAVMIFLFVLAIFDLSVGVSNDAVNFLNSALGSKAAPFKRVLTVAAIGVFIGAAMSNGMMDIARHGIFHPEHFSFYELLCIFMAVMVTDIIMLDMFNNLGLPTSTTVSLVFELLGATFVVSLIKMASIHGAFGLGDLINTEKAFTIILGIFLSVAIAFIFGIIVQFIARAIFSFNYRRNLKWKIGLFGGVCLTAIVYFLLIKGLKDMAFMTPEAKTWIHDHTAILMVGCFVVFTLAMQLLHVLRINVLKIVVLSGTFALAMAFAGNDLVNFIGVPLSTLSAYQDYTANGLGDAHGYLMGSLNAPADTSIWFLIGAGAVMVIALATSKKALKVSKTEISLGAAGGDEMFGTSRTARRLVKWALNFASLLARITPVKVRVWLNRRFDDSQAIMEKGAAFDLVRGSVNLVLAGALIAVGTSLKLPLSTTFVTFMVAMGTSLSDRAWGKESAVFRITGVISVIGGWFVTAGVAFMGAALIVSGMYYGGPWAMMALSLLTVILIVRSNRKFARKQQEDVADERFNKLLSTTDNNVSRELFVDYVVDSQFKYLTFATDTYDTVMDSFEVQNLSALDKVERALKKEKAKFKNVRRKQTLCLRHVPKATAIQMSPWFHLSNDCCMSLLYNLRRIDEVCREHLVSNFMALPPEYHDDYNYVRKQINSLLSQTTTILENQDIAAVAGLRRDCDRMKDDLSRRYHSLYGTLHEGDEANMSVVYVYLNTLQETRELVSALRKYLRAFAKLKEPSYSDRNTNVNTK